MPQRSFTNPEIQGSFEDVTEGPGRSAGPVECLGLTFESDTARRAYFLEKLRERLQDPEFRNIDGFPIGTDEDILALSDPPYYTACPNPFIEDFILHYGRPYDPSEPYHREPFAVDVSEGKNDPIYNAHSYHTKVPHRAIVRYILNYTEPDDVVLDAFCGTGMTGIAAQACAHPDTEFQMQIEQEWKEVGREIPKWGARRAILGDLSPAASLIAYNYNEPTNLALFEKASRDVIDEVDAECGWMYDTIYTDGSIGRINYTVWSDVFICPNCSNEIIFYEVAMDADEGSVSDQFACPSCGIELNKRSMERVFEVVLDAALSQTIQRAKQVPTLINYTVGGKRYEKRPDEHDLSTIARIDALSIPYWFPVVRIDKDIDIWYERDYRSLGVYAVHHFFTRRNLYLLAALWEKGKRITDPSCRSKFRFALTGMHVNLSCMNRYRPGVSFPYNPLSGTLYIGSVPVESNVLDGVSKKVELWS